MSTIGSRLGIFCVAVSLLLTACNASNTNEQKNSERADITTPEWTDIKVDAGALPDEPIWDVSATIGVQDGLPALLVGSVAQPGKAHRAAIWDAGSITAGTPTQLDLDADESWAGDLSQVGNDTYVVGWTWQDGQQTSFVQRSRDRKRWASVRVPDELVDQDVYLHTVIDDGNGSPIAIGSSQEQVVAVDLRSGEIVTLPSTEHLTSYDVGGAATIGDTLVVLVSARNEHGSDVVLPFRSTDGGRTWAASARLPGVEDSISGLVATSGGLVATGARLVGDARRTAAWVSTDGQQWRREAVPHGAVAGWGTSLGSPTTENGAVYAAVADSNLLEAQILRRTSHGTWEPFGSPTDQWRYPGTPTLLAADRNGLLVVRAEDGRLQVGRQTRTAHEWKFRVTKSIESVAPVTWWSTIRTDGDTIQAVGGRTVMEVKDGGSHWFRSHRLAAYSIADHTLVGATLTPPGASALTDLSSATGPDGTQVVVGEHRVTRVGVDRFELVGWRKPPGGTWEPVHGLSAPRTAFLVSVANVGDRWVITAKDAANTWGGHSHGALWTSTDGDNWVRQQGPFDVDPTHDSEISDVCRLPDGDLLAPGWIQDPQTSSRPLAFRRHGQKWSRASVAGLGTEVVGLSSCTTTGDVTLIEGWEITQQFWLTTDARTFTRLDIGAEGDHVGRIQSVPGGFAAPGTVLEKSKSQPVVWLSPDGASWTPIAIPVPRSMSPSEATLSGDGLVITLSSDSGPGVFVLENVAEMLKDLAG